VALVLRRVHRLLQRAQQHRLQQQEVGPVLDLLDQRAYSFADGCSPPPSVSPTPCRNVRRFSSFSGVGPS
jgi:hypothetical protein